MSEYKDYDYHGEDLEDVDWDIEGTQQCQETLSKKDVGIIEKNVLTLMENSLRDKIKKYKKEGYPDEDYPEEDVTAQMTVMDRISLLEKRMDALMSWLKTKYGYKGYYKNPYGKYPDTEKKLSLRDTVIEKLSKEDWWNTMSPQGKESQVRKEMLSLALDTPSTNRTLEKAFLSDTKLIDEIDDSFKAKKCYLCGWEDATMTWKDFLQHLERVHTPIADKYYWLIQSIEPTRWTRPQGSVPTSRELPHPESSTMPSHPMPFDTNKAWIKNYDKKMKLSKEELSQMEDLHKEFPDLSASELDRIRLLRRSK